MGGWIGFGFTLRGKRTFVEKESRLEKEGKRGLSSEGVILSIVLRAFLPVTRSPERSRLYHSVYPLFSGTFTVRYRNTTVRRCQSFPLRDSSAASPLRHRDVPARHPIHLHPPPGSLLFLIFLSFHTESSSYLKSCGKHICISPTSNARLVHLSPGYFRVLVRWWNVARMKSRRISWRSLWKFDNAEESSLPQLLPG